MTAESETKSKLSNGVGSSSSQDTTVSDLRNAKERALKKLATLRQQVNELETELELPVSSFQASGKPPRGLFPRPELLDTKLTFEEPQRTVPPMPKRDARAVARAAKTAKKSTGARGPRPGSMVEKALAFLKEHPGTKTDILAKKFKVTRVRAAGLYGQLKKMGLADSEGSHADMTWRAT